MTGSAGGGSTAPPRPAAPDADPRTASLRADAVAALTAYAPLDPGQHRLRAEYLDHLARFPDAVLKSGPPAHITASCLVIDASGHRVLLTHHRRARRWFQFGGHLEVDDPGVRSAAAREAREESGIDSVTPQPQIVDLHRHVLVGDFARCREHLDIRYAAVVPSWAQPRASTESLDVRWWPIDELPEGPGGEVADLVRAGLGALGLP